MPEDTDTEDKGGNQHQLQETATNTAMQELISERVIRVKLERDVKELKREEHARKKEIVEQNGNRWRHNK